MIHTKDRILDAAEKAFGELGYAGTSLRSVISEAKVNLAAVHYHFGSKEELLRAVIIRRVEPVNRERLARLDECEQAAGGGPVPLEKLVRAFLEPTMQIVSGPCGGIFARLLGRLYGEGDMLPQIMREHFGAQIARFTAAFLRTLPELSKDELFWRLQFCVGAMAHALRTVPHADAISGGSVQRPDLYVLKERLVRFMVAGLGGPADKTLEN